jgi:hypothetical protein
MLLLILSAVPVLQVLWLARTHEYLQESAQVGPTWLKLVPSMIWGAVTKKKL